MSGIITMTFTGNSVNMTYARHNSPSNSVVRASDWWMEGHGFDSCRGLRFFMSHTHDMLIIPSFVISSPSLKFTIFLYLSPIGHFDIADPSSMQDACHHELCKYDLCLPRIPQQLSDYSVRLVYGRSWVQFPSGTQIFSLSHARDMLIIPSFLRVHVVNKTVLLK